MLKYRVALDEPALKLRILYSVIASQKPLRSPLLQQLPGDMRFITEADPLVVSVNISPLTNTLVHLGRNKDAIFKMTTFLLHIYIQYQIQKVFMFLVITDHTVTTFI